MEKDNSLTPDEGLRVSVVDMEEGLPARSITRKQLLQRISKIFRRIFCPQKDSPSPWYKLFRNALYLLTAATVLAVIAVVFVSPNFPISRLLYLQYGSESITLCFMTWSGDSLLPSSQTRALPKLSTHGWNRAAPRQLLPRGSQTLVETSCLRQSIRTMTTGDLFLSSTHFR